MERVEKDDEREERIHMEVVVDAYDEEERAMGWYYYLDDQLEVPFQARCIAEKRTSPLQPGEVVEVTGMAPAEDCEHEMFVEVQWQGRSLRCRCPNWKALKSTKKRRRRLGTGITGWPGDMNFETGVWRTVREGA